MNQLSLKNSAIGSSYQKNLAKQPNISLIWFGFVPILAVLLSLVTTLILSPYLPKKLPLFYSLVWGEGQLATQPQLLIVPATVTILTLINLTIFWKLNPTQALLRRFLIYTTIISTIIIMISFAKIILTFI